MFLMNIYNIDMIFITVRYIFFRIFKKPIQDYDLDSIGGVTIQIPIYNEEPSMINKLLNSICQQTFPLERIEIIIIDQTDVKKIKDQTKAVVNQFTDRLSIKLIYKDRFGDGKNASTKFVAGALNLATQYTTNNIIAVIAGDSYLHKDFLRKSLPHFERNDVGFVLARNAFPHDDFLTRLTRLIYNPGYIFAIMKGSMNFPNFITGNGAVLRKEIVEEMPWDTMSEDIYMSINARIRGWNVLAEKDAIVYNVGAPVSFKAFKKTYKRAAFGQTQAIKKLFNDKNARSLALRDLQLLIHISPTIVLPLLLTLIPLNLVLFSINISQDLGFFIIFILLGFTGMFVGIFTIISTWMFGRMTDLIFYPLLLVYTIMILVPSTIGLTRSLINKPEPFYRTQRASESNPVIDLDIKVFEASMVIILAILTVFYIGLSNFQGAFFFLGFLVITLFSMTNMRVSRSENVESLA